MSLANRNRQMAFLQNHWNSSASLPKLRRYHIPLITTWQTTSSPTLTLHQLILPRDAAVTSPSTPLLRARAPDYLRSHENGDIGKLARPSLSQTASNNPDLPVRTRPVRLLVLARSWKFPSPRIPSFHLPRPEACPGTTRKIRLHCQ